jgi:ABC-type sugar transport system ATPase subunit
MVKDAVRKLDINAPSSMTEVTFLSGGNKQKVMIGRCLAATSNIYLFDEISKGIDVEVKEEIYKIVRDLASRRFSVIFTTSDLDEVNRVPDRIMVLYKGRLMKIASREEITKEELLKYANGEADTKQD